MNNRADEYRRALRWLEFSIAGLFLFLALLLILAAVTSCSGVRQKVQHETFSEFLDQVNSGIVSSVTIYEKDLRLDIELKTGQKCRSAFPLHIDIAKVLEGKVATIKIESK